MWLYRLLIILAKLLTLVATLLWKEPVFRHSWRIIMAAVVKHYTSRLVAWFHTDETTLDVLVGLLHLSLYAFVADMVIELLEEVGVPVRKLLRRLHRYMFQRPRRDGRKPSARPRRDVEEPGAPPPAQVGGTGAGSADDTTSRGGDEEPPPQS
jgi:hypothetical protein